MNLYIVLRFCKGKVGFFLWTVKRGVSHSHADFSFWTVKLMFLIHIFIIS